MRLTNTRLALLTLALVACSSGETTAATATDPPPPPPPPLTSGGAGGPSLPTGHMDGEFYVEPGAPDPRACTVDAQCTGDTVPVANGCCVANPMPIAQSQAYHVWLAAHRMAPACRAMQCPIVNPSMPPECSFAVHCTEGRCVNSCP